MAFQIAFDLVQNGGQQFLNNVRNNLPETTVVVPPPLEDTMEIEQTTEKTPLITEPTSTKAATTTAAPVQDVSIYSIYSSQCVRKHHKE